MLCIFSFWGENGHNYDFNEKNITTSVTSSSFASEMPVARDCATQLTPFPKFCVHP